MSLPLGPPWARPLMAPVSWLYEKGVRARNARFDQGEGVTTFDRPVISVGNITVGGTGKSPMVAWIARHLQSKGHRPVIAMRGYGSQPGVPGDEQREYESVLTDVPVIAHPERAKAITEFFDNADHARYDAIILDDGFQHRQVGRDLDLVLFDGSRRADSTKLIPMGLLREPLRNLARADAVIVTRTPSDPDERRAMEKLIETNFGSAPTAHCAHAWSDLEVHASSSSMERESVAWLRGRRVVVMAGIGNPRAFADQVIAAGATVVREIPARDHQVYDEAFARNVQGALEGADALIVTRKDWVKLRDHAGILLESSAHSTPVVVPNLGIRFEDGMATIDAMIDAALHRHLDS